MTVVANAHVAAMAPYALADLAVPNGRRVISLAQNESAEPPSPRAVEAAARASALINLYPDPDWTELRAAIAQTHGLDPDHILCGAGSMELIGAIMRCYAGPRAGVVASEYCYAFFRVAAQAAGARFTAAQERDLTADVDTLLTSADRSTRVVCLANPGNPTGTYIPRADVERLRNGLREDILLVVDEAYGEYAQDGQDDVFDLVARGNMVVLRTFSKAYALAGMRVGWGLFPPAVAAEIRKVMNPNNVGGVAQAAAVAAMRDQDHMRRARSRTVQTRERIAARLRQLGLTVPESQTNFLLVRFADAGTAQAAEAAMRAEGVIPRGLSGYGLADHLRITVGRDADMDFMADMLSAWVSENAS